MTSMYPRMVAEADRVAAEGDEFDTEAIRKEAS